MDKIDTIFYIIEMLLNYLRSNISVPETVIDQRDIFESIRNGLNIWPENIVLRDRYYYTTDIETWKKIIERDWVNKKKYLAERFDCDKFSRCFIAHCIEIYGLNSVGEITGIMLFDGTSGLHSFNCFIDNKKNVYILEPQIDQIVLLEFGKPVKIGEVYYGFKRIDI